MSENKEMNQVKKFCEYWNDGIHVNCSFPFTEGRNIECIKDCNVYKSIKNVLDYKTLTLTQGVGNLH